MKISVTTNKINSKDILLECLDTSKNTSDEMVKNENSDEKILKCSNLVKIINSNELFQTDKIENINGVQLKCSNTVKNIGKSEIPLLDSGGSNDIILKCSNVSEDLSKDETKINNGIGNSTEITFKMFQYS